MTGSREHDADADYQQGYQAPQPTSETHREDDTLNFK